MFNLTAVMETPLGVGGLTIESLLFFTLILVIGVLIARIVSINVRRALSERLPANERELFTKLVYYGIVILAFLAALPQLSVDLSGLLVAGGIAGIVIGFASQSVISNLISGLFLMFERPIRIGDNINVSDVTGSVEDIRVLSTVIKTFDGIYIRIPNEKVFTSNITNYVHNVARRFAYLISIRYQDDADPGDPDCKGGHRDPSVCAQETFALGLCRQPGGQWCQIDGVYLGACAELVGGQDGSSMEDQEGARGERHQDIPPPAHGMVPGAA